MIEKKNGKAGRDKMVSEFDRGIIVDAYKARVADAVDYNH